ncbi:CAP domain-containing protein [Georgenia alba]|uniref:CAP domain-containing protein n=1 Tax=Georgenia alba TaxID=2233858 RepID=A0ABW2QAL9_9MICO
MTTVDLDAYADELFAETNAFRETEDRPPLERSDCAIRHARDRAEALTGGDALEHAPMNDVLDACDASWSGENLVRSAAEPAEVVTAWSNSSGHRMNLLTTEAESLGVACVRDGEELLCSQVYLGPGGG